MRLLVFSTKTDAGAKAILRQAQKDGLPYKAYFCEELFYKDGTIWNSNKKPLNINKTDKIILRDPYSAKYNYSFFTRKILKDHYNKILLDRERHLKYPFYEDKLFQADLFVKLGINTPSTFFGKDIEKITTFPVIAKRRIGSRGRWIRILDNREELELFFEKHNRLNYIIQTYHKIKNEYRILVLKQKVLGVVDKNVVLKPGGKVGVTIKSNAKSVPKRIKQQALTFTKEPKADFVGIDVILAEDNKYYFLEANLSPQFDGFERATGINVAKKIIALAQSQSPQ